MQNRGRVLSREQILRKVWGYDDLGLTRTVDVHVGRLRHKIEDNPSHPKLVITVRNAGYRLSA